MVVLYVKPDRIFYQCTIFPRTANVKNRCGKLTIGSTLVPEPNTVTTTFPNDPSPCDTTTTNHINANAVDKHNNVLFTRTNVIFDTIEKITSHPYMFDDSDDENIIANNKEVAKLFAIFIIVSIAYIIILDWMTPKKD